MAAAAGAVRLGRLGLQRGKRPLASLLLTGPAGVGKSTLCLGLAESLFGSDRHLLRFNMAEYADRASGKWQGHVAGAWCRLCLAQTAAHLCCWQCPSAADLPRISMLLRETICASFPVVQSAA